MNSTATTHVNYERLLKTLQAIVERDGMKVVGATISGDLTALATEDTLEAIRVLVDSYVSGGFAKSEAYFIKDGVVLPVEEDTLTPSNNNPFPVKLVAESGTVTITAGDLNVQLSHAGASYDSTRIGDGTNLLAINTDGSVNVKELQSVGSNIGHIYHGGISSSSATQVHPAGATCISCTITSSELNTGWIKVGGSAASAGQGVILYPSESWTFKVTNTNLIYARAEISNSAVSLTYTY